ncbi:GNAT family N-acetyltransferase [Devriesea agamarum]|uniref:GNAT family N-acetyltransferase n=1 Tax=Devriesea agamarum TaxID=472569 RepID=UPI00071D36FD|nr:GNAT family N-acetyltransferase [Devriesea agamarum]
MVIIRDYRESDAPAVADLFTSHADNPNPVSSGVTAQQFHREITDRGPYCFLLACDDDRVIGTIGVFRSNGRRTAHPGEGIADMFFVAPRYRQSVVTGRLFSEASDCMLREKLSVLTLTVNPANTAALRVYRRVGCVCIDHPQPGADGNVQLANFIPLIVRAIIDDLDDDMRAGLRSLTAFGGLTTRLSNQLQPDTFWDRGRRSVRYHLGLGAVQVRAVVDVDAATVTTAELELASGDTRPVVLTNPPARPIATPGEHTHHRGDFALRVSAADGTVTLTHRHIDGPLMQWALPAHVPHRAGGWRECNPRPLTIARVPNGFVITQHDRADQEHRDAPEHRDAQEDQRAPEDRGQEPCDLSCRIELGANTVTHTIHGLPDAPVRMFQWVGVRQGWLTVGAIEPLPTSTPTSDQHISPSLCPVGDDVAVPDASEMPAAGTALPPNCVITWYDSDARPVASTAGPADTLVHSHLLDRRLRTDRTGTVHLSTSIMLCDATEQRPSAPNNSEPTAIPVAAEPAPELAQEKFTVDAGSHAVTRWIVNGRSVVRSAPSRRRAFACNPVWSHGIWTSQEISRQDRRHGIGWGLRPAEDDPDAIIPQLRHRVGDNGPGCHDLTVLAPPIFMPTFAPAPAPVPTPAPTPAPAPVPVTVTASENVLWVTPRHRTGGRIVFPGPSGLWSLTASRRWQRWTCGVAVELDAGFWFQIGPAPGYHDALSPEILVRSTSSGLLIGCVSRAIGPDAPMTWRLRITGAPTGPCQTVRLLEQSHTDQLPAALNPEATQPVHTRPSQFTQYPVSDSSLPHRKDD